MAASEDGEPVYNIKDLVLNTPVVQESRDVI